MGRLVGFHSCMRWVDGGAVGPVGGLGGKEGVGGVHGWVGGEVGLACTLFQGHGMHCSRLITHVVECMLVLGMAGPGCVLTGVACGFAGEGELPMRPIWGWG